MHAVTCTPWRARLVLQTDALLQEQRATAGFSWAKKFGGNVMMLVLRWLWLNLNCLGTRAEFPVLKHNPNLFFILLKRRCCCYLWKDTLEYKLAFAGTRPLIMIFPLPESHWNNINKYKECPELISHHLLLFCFLQPPCFIFTEAVRHFRWRLTHCYWCAASFFYKL